MKVISLKNNLWIILSLLAVVAFVSATILSHVITLQSSGTIKAIGISVYQDESCTTPLTVIDWGWLTPDSTVTFECWLRNEGTVSVVVNMHTKDWIPDNATQVIDFTWNAENSIVQPDMTLHVIFSLTIHPDAAIPTFSFDIVIVGSEPVVAGRR